MAKKTKQGERASSYEAEQRSAIVKSSLTGVAATVVAVTMCSSAGLGGFVGASAANGLDTGMSPNNIRARDGGPAFPDVRVPLTNAEISEIRSRLDDSGSTLDQVRRDTDAAIEMLRTIADNGASTRSDFASNARPEDVELARLLLRDTNAG